MHVDIWRTDRIQKTSSGSLAIWAVRYIGNELMRVIKMHGILVITFIYDHVIDASHFGDICLTLFEVEIIKFIWKIGKFFKRLLLILLAMHKQILINFLYFHQIMVLVLTASSIIAR